MSPFQRACHELTWFVVVKILLHPPFALFVRKQVLFDTPPEKDRGFILASNHISHFDPPLLTTSFPRKIDWIAVVELFHGKVLKALFTNLNVIPVDRSGADRNALRTAAKRLQEGRVVGIFPEGGIRDGAASIVNGAPMKTGFVLLSTLAHAPILPCVILGSERLYNAKNWLPWRRPQVWIAYGRLIEPAGEKSRQNLNDEFVAEIAKLKEKLISHFNLTDADLPHSPQQRMAEP